MESHLENYIKSSKRRFTIYVIDGKGRNTLIEEVPLVELMTTDDEVYYSILVNVDDVLDMPENCSLVFELRDDKLSKGIVTRIS